MWCYSQTWRGSQGIAQAGLWHTLARRTRTGCRLWWFGEAMPTTGSRTGTLGYQLMTLFGEEVQPHREQALSVHSLARFQFALSVSCSHSRS